MRGVLAVIVMWAACGEPGVDTDEGVTDDSTPGDTDVVQSTSELVEPDCIDGQWAETLPNTTADLSGVAFDDVEDWVKGVLDLRYPTGTVLVEGGLASDLFGGSCIDLFTSPQQRSSAAGMYPALSTITHECGHFHDIELGGFTSSAYQMTADVLLTCSGGSSMNTPARSRIMGDAYAASRPACDGDRGRNCDSYADLYLDGDPDDGTFDSGDQGLDLLLEEAVQYVHSLATEMAFADRIQQGGSVSGRDGILTFLWYIERYLAWMRVNDTQAYDAVLASDCWRETILSVWGRAWLYLDATEGDDRLGISDDDIESLVMEPALLREIQRVRDAEGC